MKSFTRGLSIAAIGCAISLPVHAFQSDRIHVTTAGDGPAVILIPGLNGSPAVWDNLRPHFEGYALHLVHVRGFAGLAAEANGEGDVLSPVASELARYIAEEDLENVRLIGHSMGGMVGIIAAAEAPASIGGVMVIDIPAYFAEMMGIPPEQVSGAAQHMMSEALARSHEEHLAAETAFITAGILDAEKRAPVLAAMQASNPTVSARAQHDVIVADVRPYLDDIDAPMSVVFVTPAMAPNMTPEAIEGFYAQQYAAAADVSLHFVADAGHYVMLDQPELFLELVQQFLQSATE